MVSDQNPVIRNRSALFRLLQSAMATPVSRFPRPPVGLLENTRGPIRCAFPEFAPKVDPISDIEVIQTELCLADLAAVEKALHRVTKTARSGDKESAKLVAILEKCQTALNQAKPVRTLDWSKEERWENDEKPRLTA